MVLLMLLLLVLALILLLLLYRAGKGAAGQAYARASEAYVGGPVDGGWSWPRERWTERGLLSK